ncbi:restriction endonuclease subunit S [Helicobacter bizzozeronii]|uniref:restriction endonuclease subunit S n=1 Tax=Helicobacter bizzozeronii TaxID=56877 RepID=UPI000CEF45D1|nr:restriction endonuclease subunit S [Helicobacter bizzozeronii]
MLLSQKKTLLQKIKQSMLELLLTTRALRFKGESGVWEEVELGEIGKFVRGSGLTKADLYPDNQGGKLVGAIHYGEIHTYYKNHTDKVISFVSPLLAQKLKKVDEGDIIIAVTSEDIAGVCCAVAWLGDAQIVTGGHTAIFKHSQISKFIAYWLQSEYFSGQKRNIAHGIKVIEVSPKNLGKILIPLPPLPTQQKIAHLLSTLDRLIELTHQEQQLLARITRALRDQLICKEN